MNADWGIAAVPLAALEWATAVVPLPRPLRVGAMTVRSRAYCCVRATLPSGAQGEAFVLTRGLDVDAAIATLFAARAVAGEELRSAVRNVGWDGAISRAASAIRLAALDAAARERALPVWRLLGAERAPATPAAVIVGPVLAGEDPGADDVREAVAAVEAGVACVKLMGGVGAPADDLRRLARVREAVGDEVVLALDVNGGWSPAEGHAALPRLAAAGVEIVEEPWAYEHGLATFEGLPAERPQLAFGEISSSVIELEGLLATGAVEHLRLDATLLGGPEPVAALAPALAAAGAAAFPHFWPEVHRHLVALLPRASYIECTLPGSRGDVPHGLAAPELTPAGGRIAAGEEPGFGFALDWERIRRLAPAAPQRVVAAEEPA